MQEISGIDPGWNDSNICCHDGMAACAQPRLPERAKLEHASARFRALSHPARLTIVLARLRARHDAQFVTRQRISTIRFLAVTFCVCMESAMEHGAEKQHSVPLTKKRRKRHHDHLH
jgi:hypothetical protein